MQQPKNLNKILENGTNKIKLTIFLLFFICVRLGILLTNYIKSPIGSFTFTKYGSCNLKQQIFKNNFLYYNLKNELKKIYFVYVLFKIKILNKKSAKFV